jgi:hypothetical protein
MSTTRDLAAQDCASDLAEDIRLIIYRRLSTTGRAPTTAEIATIVGAPPGVVEQALRALHERRQGRLGGGYAQRRPGSRRA